MLLFLINNNYYIANMISEGTGKNGFCMPTSHPAPPPPRSRSWAPRYSSPQNRTGPVSHNEVRRVDLRWWSLGRAFMLEAYGKEIMGFSSACFLLWLSDGKLARMDGGLTQDSKSHFLLHLRKGSPSPEDCVCVWGGRSGWRTRLPSCVYSKDEG